MRTTARTSQGELRGRVEDGLVVFRGVRYAEVERFRPPRPVPAWTGVREALVDGPIAPQRPSRLEHVMGAPEPHDQAEDCLSLTITTPGVDDAARPVLVWLHGGAFLSGAGSWRWYGGHRLAREGDVVVVGVNYRLGALGYLRSPGLSEGNLGLRDQIAALRWVRDNIAAFGGDPSTVTVVGQSAGAHSVACLLGIPEARSLFRRAILQSPPMGLGLGDPRRARRSAERFLAGLASDPRTAEIPAILDAQQRVLRRQSGPLGMNTAPPFMPVAGAGVLPDRARWWEHVVRTAPDLDVILGWTGREMGAFYTTNPTFQRLRQIPTYGPRAADAVGEAVGSAVFARPTLRLASRLSAVGARVWAYQFDYAPAGSPFGACHCLELPLLFGTDADWADAPMLTGADPAEIADLGRRLRASWLSFARTGKPETDADLPWPEHTPTTRAVRHWSS
ncbi:para-nitrobenzyl esterase [Streptoalloteichus tenebrarius]|uniref:Carboxylic ester hydrolase n=1 Tax=Streptoalloteichus tenebrarius (strain ATCC 17920 / DSM 40477 / JCM 4838 / CBS 697.72 / NBRC 16177 / NCIMB 11028 / NRRL B-12390 / A12253. 1 / ISP 5477) TaxID=1933 RepID=A0ABT1HM39_STRSD|nr:carboxylesterase family protein [Streptoalloteichus tenebrarius]MCP2256558.1 para-nitrobenzyl esterase [Streptoalloteichus tenebrarius]BFF04913.1 carboxylesterase family protein [Streptoalloteichus tenebrarius]